MATKVWIPKWKLKSVVSEESSDETKLTKSKLEPVVSEESSDENMATKLMNLKFEPVVSRERSSGNMATKLTRSRLEPESSGVNVDDDDGSESGNEDLGLTMDKLNLGPKKKLLVLCLGGLLVHRVHKFYSNILPRSRADYDRGNFLIFKRPFCDEFLKFCFERFEVALWSSAREHNIEPLLNYVMGGLQRKLIFVWDQEECTDSGFSCLEKSDKPIFLKDLTKVWEKKWPSGKFSAANTLLIDNDPYKGQMNPPHTGIYPEQYNVENKYKDQFLAPKGVLQEYLDGVADAEDVPTYVKDHTFGQQELATGIKTRRLLQLLARPK